MSTNEYYNLNKFLYDQQDMPSIKNLDFPNSSKDSKIVETKIQEDVFLMKNDIFLKKDTQIQTNSQIDGMLFTFILKGNQSYKSLLTDYIIKAQNNFTNISLMNKEEGIENFEKEVSIKSINIVVKKSFLRNNFPKNKMSEKIFKKLENEECNLVLRNCKTNYKTSLLTNEIYNSCFLGDLERLFLHAKTLEILHTEFSELFKENLINKNEKVKFSEYDINAIHLARDILLNNIQNPPSIMELSKLVKLNEFKLKTGFRKIFNIAPYKYLHEYKMQRAKTLLENSDMNVTEISHEIGYKFIHSFSKVFAQRFGILPKDLMKSRKYYY